MKKIIIITAASTARMFLSSLKRREKNCGIVKDFVSWVYLRSLAAVNSQFRYVPTARPIAVQPTSATPERYASPGRPISR